MASYEKLTLDRFKVSLKEGKYTGLTGARRAIGKTTSWSKAERATAQELANKHFGEDGTATAKPAKKTASKKTAAKKVSTKGVHASKPARKNAAKKLSGFNADQHTPHSSISAASSAAIQASTGFEHRVAAHESLAFVSHARQELQQLKQMNSSIDISKNEKILFEILENAIAHMSKTLPHAGAQATAVPRIEVPKSDGTPRRIVKNIVTDVAQAPAPAPQTVGEVQANGVDDADLTDAEREARDLLSTGPDLGLPRPSQV